VAASFPVAMRPGRWCFIFLMCAEFSRSVIPNLRQAALLGSTLWVALIWISTLLLAVSNWLSPTSFAGAAVGFILADPSCLKRLVSVKPGQPEWNGTRIPL